MANGHESGLAAETRSSVGQTAYKRHLAYRILGINPESVQSIPFFRSQLRRIARCVNRGGRKDERRLPVGPLDFLESSEDPDARKVSKIYLSVPESYRRLLPPEAFCAAAGVSPWRILEAITVVAVREGAQASVILAAVTHPRVVAKTVERALEDDGVADRIVLHKAMGFLPTSKSA